MSSEYFAACSLGLETALQSELEALGATQIEPKRGGVSFTTDRLGGYRAALWLRTAVRLQEMLVRGKARGREALHALVTELPWEQMMSVDQTLAVDASVRDSEVTHSGFAALTVKDAVVDRFRKVAGRRPSVDTENPHVPLKLVLNRDVATVYRDLSGDSLHKRGWRPIQVKSPLNEATAAGLLMVGGWDRKSPLIDPMCGSGTFVIEAAMMAADRAPGIDRTFAFHRWPDFDAVGWAGLVADARSRARSTLPFMIAGADRHPGALALAQRGAVAAGVADIVTFTNADLDDWVPPSKPAWVYTNPPWGERLGEGDDLIISWRALGAFLKRHAPGANACVLSGNSEVTRHLGMKAARRFPVMVGPIECRLLRYEIHDRPPGPPSEPSPPA